ncbi:MAG TPA: serine/threonine-protein kinase, partial [Bacteroidota bacterium]|nr:serine/threonine-protein kinase [Bacteroidota bacterium]
MIGRTISHYKIIEKLGEGGMGVVYLAQDTTLDRRVALKFLPDLLKGTLDEKARFIREAKAAAALNHPNICTMYAVEEADSTLFMAMEYIDGATLRSHLPFTNANEALGVAVRIAEGLSEAHTAGIVHRDIKADNIMLTAKGQVKIMDFGLAKVRGSLDLTRNTSTVGTLAYMSPEQIQGGEATPRSDVFSFGVLLFEMLTGKLPFRGEHEAAMIYSIVNEPPVELRSLQPSVPSAFEAVVNRCLEKDPQKRYGDARELLTDLRGLQQGKSPASLPQTSKTNSSKI